MSSFPTNTHGKFSMVQLAGFKALSRMSSFPTAERSSRRRKSHPFQSAVAHELISNLIAQCHLRNEERSFKALSRMSSFPTQVIVHNHREVV